MEASSSNTQLWQALDNKEELLEEKNAEIKESNAATLKQRDRVIKAQLAELESLRAAADEANNTAAALQKSNIRLTEKIGMLFFSSFFSFIESMHIKLGFCFIKQFSLIYWYACRTKYWKNIGKLENKKTREKERKRKISHFLMENFRSSRVSSEIIKGRFDGKD